MKHQIQAVAFDVIGTLFDISPLEERLTRAGLRSGSLDLWFARVLRDGFALEVSGAFKPFREVASGALTALMREQNLTPDHDAIEAVIAAFAELPCHKDVEPAFQFLHECGVTIVALTNGGAKSTRALFENAGLARYVARFFSIDDVAHWKPSREVYLHVADALALAPNQLALVAAHDWDVDGAQRAGVIAAGVLRKPFSSAFEMPDVRGDDLTSVVNSLLKTGA